VRVLINRAAGTVERQEGQSLDDLLGDAFRESGIAATFDVVDGQRLEESAILARQMAEGGSIDAIVVGGGDGTVRTVAGALAGSDVPLGILPLGTLNHFARDVGLPLDPRHAVAVIAGGSPAASISPRSMGVSSSTTRPSASIPTWCSTGIVGKPATGSRNGRQWRLLSSAASDGSRAGA
jgi:hypothetical protein